MGIGGEGGNLGDRIVGKILIISAYVYQFSSHPLLFP